MKYKVSPDVFELNPSLRFGILIGKELKNTETSATDAARLRSAETTIRTLIPVEELRSHPSVHGYRLTMENAGINPNKYAPSIEAMLKRVLKGSSLPEINSLVDLCNAVSLETQLSLGGHDLRDMPDDLAVRFTTGTERFLPFGATEYEAVEAGELVFTSGETVQTRKWVWRQSELGKMDLNTKDVFFQLVGFEDGADGDVMDSDAALSKSNPLTIALDSISDLISNRFGGKCERFIVTAANNEIEF